MTQPLAAPDRSLRPSDSSVRPSDSSVRPSDSSLRSMAELCAPQPPALTIENLSLTIGRTPIIEALSLSLTAGHLLCLLGPSGGGKTSLLRAIAGLERCHRGRIDLNGRTVLSVSEGIELPPERRGVGLMFQDFALFPHLTVAENVAFGLHRRARDDRKAAVQHWIHRLGLEGLEQRLPGELSGGQQQRVALARALAPEPALLLLDEPFSGLDQRLRSALRDDFLHLIKQSGITAIMVTHDPVEAMFMADSIAIIRDGRIEQRGQPDELYFQPRSEFVAGFFGEVNLFPGRFENGLLTTALGRLKPSDACVRQRLDGDCRVLVRAEAIRLCPVSQLAVGSEDDMAIAEVQTARMIGNESVIHLTLLDRTLQDPHVHAKVPGAFLPQAGERFGLGLNSDLIYAFPAAGQRENGPA